MKNRCESNRIHFLNSANIESQDSRQKSGFTTHPISVENSRGSSRKNSIEYFHKKSECHQSQLPEIPK